MTQRRGNSKVTVELLNISPYRIPHIVSLHIVFLHNLRKKKWLLCCSYNPHKNSISTHIDFLRRELDLHSSNCENFILLGYFNSEMTDTNFKNFCNLYLLKNLIKKPTCFKNPENPTMNF